MKIHSQLKVEIMKTEQGLYNPEGNVHTGITGTGNRIRTSIMIIFMLAWSALLTSCMVAVPVPRHPPRPGVIIEMDDHGGHHDNGRHNGR